MLFYFDLEHLMLNSSFIEGRYSGLFKGMIITESIDWAKGNFNFENDPVFSLVPLLPLFNFNYEILRVKNNEL